MTKLIEIKSERILRHMLNTSAHRETKTTFQCVEADQHVPEFNSGFFLANIGETQNPLLLELRLVQASANVGIALLMTNERFPRDLTAMADEIIRRLDHKSIEFDAVIGPESLGPKITQEIARIKGPWTLHTSLQKGKLQRDPETGQFAIGPPKTWVEDSASISLSSATTENLSQQKLYLDQTIAEQFQGLKKGVLFVDDARLSSGTVDASIALLKKMNIPIAAVVTVLNEADATDEIDGVPYLWLSKLPLFDRTEQGWIPKAGSYQGLTHFYLEQ